MIDKIKSYFEIHSRFRNGILVLLGLLFTIVVVYYFYDKPLGNQSDFEELTKFQNQIDSLKNLAQQEKKQYKLKPFNPNFITDYKGYTLGLSAKELDRLNLYRNQGKWINSVEDFQNVTKASDSLLNRISPLFKFPAWIKKIKHSKKKQATKYPTKTYDQKEDLNTVGSSALQEKINLPDFIADRIVKYRDAIGGFVHDMQLKDVKGLYDHQRMKMLSLYTVKNSKEIKKININTASVKDLIEIPYFDFETALNIRDFIKSNGSVSSFEELGKIKGFSLEKIDRITLYLTLK